MRNMITNSLILLIFLLITSLSAGAGTSAAKGGLEVGQAWARASIGAARSGVVYLGVMNRGTAADRLIGAETPVAKKAALHAHIEDDGVMKMRPVDGVELPAGGGTVLEPGGMHIMLMGLKAPLAEDARFPLTLIFERTGPLEVEVTVKSATAQSGGD